MKAIITIGISASGKTTWANQQVGYKIICRDDIRKEILIERKGEEAADNIWENWNFKWEGEVTKRHENLMDAHALMKDDIIIADTNLNQERRRNLAIRLRKAGYTVEFKEFPIAYEVAVKRDARRKNGVGPDIIARQLDQWNEQFVEKWDFWDPKLPPCVIFDIDGTVADHNGRSPYAWEKVGEDTLNFAVAAIASMFYETGTTVIFLSGRDGISYKATKRWLMNHLGLGSSYEIGQFHLFMRAEGDTRPDTIIKEELFQQHVMNRYNVAAVFDDRPKVCRMWRSHGFDVFQVGNPYLEF